MSDLLLPMIQVVTQRSTMKCPCLSRNHVSPNLSFSSSITSYYPTCVIYILADFILSIHPPRPIVNLFPFPLFEASPPLVDLIPQTIIAIATSHLSSN